MTFYQHLSREKQGLYSRAYALGLTDFHWTAAHILSAIHGFQHAIAYLDYVGAHEVTHGRIPAALTRGDSMADMPLYEGDTVILHWGTLHWECQVYRNEELCVQCGGATVRIDPPWETWRLLCCAESALTTTHVQYMEALDTLRPGAIGMVSSIPVQVEKKEQ